MKTQPYYTLLIKEETHQGFIWTQQFGDSDKETVQQELEDSWYYPGEVKKKDAKIICTPEDQVVINTTVAKLNHDLTQADRARNMSSVATKKVVSINAVHTAIHSIIDDVAFTHIQDNWKVKKNGEC